MELRILLLLLLHCPGLPAQTPEAEMSQQEGSTFSIQCPYTTQADHEQEKAWCRMRNARCELVAWRFASTEYIYSDRARQGHVTIQDDNRTVSITMSDLQVEDSGIYSCTYSSSYIPLKTISLNVYKELHKWELDSLSVQCPYRALGYSWGRKAWCRQQGQAQCSLVVSTVYPSARGSSGTQNKRSSIQDDAQTGTVTITMHELQALDSGVYWCALYNPYQRSAFTRIMEVRLSVDKGLPAQTPEAEMSQQEGSMFSIQCPYTTQADHKQEKAWCRVRNARCELVAWRFASTEYIYSDRARQGHVTIQDDNRTVSITMSDLQVEDSGIYSCMYSSSYIPLKTISLNVYKELHKWELDSLSVQCPYRALGYSWGRKAWCRQQGQAQCSLVVSTVYPSARGSSGTQNKRSSIQDDAQTGTVTITMHELQALDSGVYWCALYNPYQRSAFTRIMEVRLSVDKGLPAQTPEAEMSQQEGSMFSIQCPYTTQADHKQEKAWCRVRNARCELVAWRFASTEYIYSDRARQGHVTIQDDNRTVSITMSDLQVEDSGIYSCMYSSSYIPLKTISLNVYKELHKWELDSLSVQCPYRALGYSWGRKAWCRQQGQAQCSLVVSTVYPSARGSSGTQNKRSSIQDDAQTGTVTITMHELQALDSGVYWCALYNPYQRSAFTRIMEVRLSVDKVPAATTLSVTTGASETNSTQLNSTQPWNTIIISVVLCILLVLALAIMITLCIRQRKKMKTGGNRQAEDIYDKPESPAQLESTERTGGTTDDGRDLNYITLDFKPHPSSDEPLYCNVELSQTTNKPEDENVEYAVIACKQLSTNDKG